MKKCKGYIDSVYSGSAVDGKGLRVVVFFSGCNLRCPFCHNPETLYNKGEEIELEALVKKIKRYSSYIKRGGVTLSGGEPFLQKEFVLALINRLSEEGISVAIETNGTIIDKEIINCAEYLICDVKNQQTDDLSGYEKFLQTAKNSNKKVELTCVIVSGVNDGQEKLVTLKNLAKNYEQTVIGIRLLPFKKLCIEKYNKIGLEFPYKDKYEPTKQDIEKCYEIIK